MRQYLLDLASDGMSAIVIIGFMTVVLSVCAAVA